QTEETAISLSGSLFRLWPGARVANEKRDSKKNKAIPREKKQLPTQKRNIYVLRSQGVGWESTGHPFRIMPGKQYNSAIGYRCLEKKDLDSIHKPPAMPG
ncbi:MAG: hypothetical protein PVG67_08610, partial [Desulfobacterales bacterium]